MTGLPKGWAEPRLDECAHINPPLNADVSPETPVSFVPMPAVSEVEGAITSASVRPFREASKGYTRFREGDVIFAKITPCMENGKIAIATGLNNGIGCGSTEFHVLRPYGVADRAYLWRFLRQETFRADAEQAMTGAVGHWPGASVRRFLVCGSCARAGGRGSDRASPNESSGQPS